MATSKFVEANAEIADKVVSEYKKVEKGVVGGFTHMSDSFVERFLAADGETVEEAKRRVAQEYARCTESCGGCPGADAAYRAAVYGRNRCAFSRKDKSA